MSSFHPVFVVILAILLLGFSQQEICFLNFKSFLTDLRLDSVPKT